MFENSQKKSSTTGRSKKFWIRTRHLALENSSKSVYALPLKVSLQFHDFLKLRFSLFFPVGTTCM